MERTGDIRSFERARPIRDGDVVAIAVSRTDVVPFKVIEMDRPFNFCGVEGCSWRRIASSDPLRVLLDTSECERCRLDGRKDLDGGGERIGSRLMSSRLEVWGS